MKVCAQSFILGFALNLHTYCLFSSPHISLSVLSDIVCFRLAIFMYRIRPLRISALNRKSKWKWKKNLGKFDMKNYALPWIIMWRIRKKTMKNVHRIFVFLYSLLFLGQKIISATKRHILTGEMHFKVCQCQPIKQLMGSSDNCEMLRMLPQTVTIGRHWWSQQLRHSICVWPPWPVKVRTQSCLNCFPKTIELLGLR